MTKNKSKIDRISNPYQMIDYRHLCQIYVTIIIIIIIIHSDFTAV